MDKRRRRRPYQVDLKLTPEDRDAYEAYLSDKRTTGEMAIEWLKARGYRLSWGAVFRHRQKFLDELQDVQRWARVAAHFSAAARAEGGTVLAEATLTRFEQMFMQMLFEMEKAGGQGGRSDGAAPAAAGGGPAAPAGRGMTSREWAELAGALSKVVASRAHVEQQRREFEDRARRVAEEVQQHARRPADGLTIANRVREILGVPLAKPTDR